MQKDAYPEIVDKLLRWFSADGRDLPWRREYSPYEIWISEIMLQQTQVKTMLPYFSRWMGRFPGVPSVAEASEEELLKHWEGMGYYSRVRNIHRTAKILVRDFGGELPREHRAVLSLPGIGPYTAGAIMSLAFNEDFPVVDGNVERVFARLFDMKAPVKEKDSQAFIWETARAMLPRGDARRFNQALMDLGATVCLPRRPSCPQCPVRLRCESARLNLVEQRPVPGRRRAVEPIDVALGVLVKGGRILVQKRPPSGLMPHLWEFPGGKVKDGETPEAALVREFHEELELEICCLEKIALIRHSYTSFRVALHAYFCKLSHNDQAPILHGAVDLRWVTQAELASYAFPAANRRLIRLLEKVLSHEC